VLKQSGEWWKLRSQQKRNQIPIAEPLTRMVAGVEFIDENGGGPGVRL
jgi:hypothetical protein